MIGEEEFKLCLILFFAADCDTVHRRGAGGRSHGGRWTEHEHTGRESTPHIQGTKSAWASREAAQCFRRAQLESHSMRRTQSLDYCWLIKTRILYMYSLPMQKVFWFHLFLFIIKSIYFLIYFYFHNSWRNKKSIGQAKLNVKLF